MRRSLLPAAALLLLSAGPAAAGRPANGYFYYSYIQDLNGRNLGKVEWNWDGKRDFTLGTPQTFPGTGAAYGLAFTWDHALLVAGKHKGELYRVKPGDQAYGVQRNSWDNPEHIFIEPGLKTAWVTDNRGALYRQPLDPYGQAVEVRPAGSERGIHTIAYKDAGTAWYTQSTESESTHVGELDTGTMSTRRRLTIAPFVNDSRYDPFTGHVLLCGDKVLMQYDPVANAIVSQREFKRATELYACVVDGEGRVILSSWDGDVFLIDYSGTGMVGDTSNPGDTAHLVDKMYYLTPLIGPGSPPRVHRPIYAGAGGAFRDGDGDGRIDGAVLRFKTAVPGFPAQVRLADPSDPARSMVFDSTRFARLDSNGFLIDLRDPPLAFGTSVRPGAAARILGDTVLFGNADLPMGDETGPQVVAAEAHPPRKKGGKPVLAVTFSEGVGVSAAPDRFPFLVRRAGAGLDGKIRVESVRGLGSRRYEYVLASEDYPLLGDSLKLIPGDTSVRDSAGNPNNMSVWIGVGGEPPSAFTILPESGATVVSYGAPAPLPRAPAVLVVHPAAEGGICLNCAGNGLAAALVAQPPPIGPQDTHPWLMTVKIQGPVRYSLGFYDNLGAFVNRADGEVTPDMLRKMRPGSDRLYTIRLYWWPVDRDGRQAATGAYIMRGDLSGGIPDGPSPPSSAQAPEPRKNEKISAFFGFLRRL